VLQLVSPTLSLPVSALDLHKCPSADSEALAPQGRSTPEAVRDALAGGAGAVQLRLKDGDGGACLRQVRDRLPHHRPWLRYAREPPPPVGAPCIHEGTFRCCNFQRRDVWEVARV
jgi:hypothetical protein